MPTKNPRVNITVTPERHDLLRRLSAFQGTSMSGLVSETMEMMYPVMERVCVVLEAAQRAQETSKEGLRESIAKAEAELLPMLYQAVGQFDLFVDDAAKSVGISFDSEGKTSDAIRKAMGGGAAAAEGARERGSAVGAPMHSPRTSDTGVRSPKSVDKSIKRRGSKS